MFEARFIRPNVIPSSSLILLVCKKDVSWRMCIDFKILNKIIMKDKFPIPIIDELLNKLHGIKYFSKLDL